MSLKLYNEDRSEVIYDTIEKSNDFCLCTMIVRNKVLAAGSYMCEA